MNHNTRINLRMIKSLRESKVLHPELLEKRIAIAEREIKSLRTFANHKPAGHVANYCNKLVFQLESELK